jgi:hypothetical protein
VKRLLVLGLVAVVLLATGCGSNDRPRFMRLTTLRPVCEDVGDFLYLQYIALRRGTFPESCELAFLPDG